MVRNVIKPLKWFKWSVRPDININTYINTLYIPKKDEPLFWKKEEQKPHEVTKFAKVV